MKTTDVIQFMDNINTVISFIEGALQMDDIVHFKLEDSGDIINFSIQRGRHNVLCEEIVKLDEDSLRVIYASIAAKYDKRMEVGALSNFKNHEVIWSLAPVIGDKALVEFISKNEKDQEWFFEIINDSTKQKEL